MEQNRGGLPQGAGAENRKTTGSSESSGSSSTASIGTGSSRPAAGSYGQEGPATSTYRREELGSLSTDRSVVLRERQRSRPSSAMMVGATLGAVALGAIPFMLSGRSRSRDTDYDSQGERAEAEAVVIVDRPARQLYDFWRDFTNFPQFMDNIESVEKLDDRRSHWVIKAPAGTSVEFDSRITEDVPGSVIAWQSEEGASVPNRGRVEFIEATGGKRTTVRTVISYDPPAGQAGRLVAKLFRREPEVQARQDLNRFKELMESRSGS
ncbi:MAG TPA: SRPBCC family protein [Allosphingosinicella sp.]|nr:SRPBCC family protein [Allosphingosinicella sp.]